MILITLFATSDMSGAATGDMEKRRKSLASTQTLGRGGGRRSGCSRDPQPPRLVVPRDLGGFRGLVQGFVAQSRRARA